MKCLSFAFDQEIAMAARECSFKISAQVLVCLWKFLDVIQRVFKPRESLNPHETTWLKQRKP